MEERVGFYRNHLKSFQNHLYGQAALTFDNRQMNEQFNIIKNLLCLFFI